MARLWALMISLISPVKPSENSVMGMRRDLPPPAAVPLTFMSGFARRLTETATDVLPSLPEPLDQTHARRRFSLPRGVGVISGVTSIYFPSGLLFRRSMILMKSSLHNFPIGMISSG